MDPEIVPQQAEQSADVLYLADAHDLLDARMAEGATPTEAWSEVVGEQAIAVDLAEPGMPMAPGRARFKISDESINHRGDRVLTKKMDLGPFGRKTGGPVYWNHNTYRLPSGTAFAQKQPPDVFADVQIYQAPSDQIDQFGGYCFERDLSNRLDARVPFFPSVGLMARSAVRVDEGNNGRRGWDIVESYLIELTLTGTPCNSNATRMSLMRGGDTDPERLARSLKLTLPAAPDLSPLAALLACDAAELAGATADRLGELLEATIARRMSAERARAELPGLCAQAALAIAAGREPDAGLVARCAELGVEAPWGGPAWATFRAAAPLVGEAALGDLAERSGLAELAVVLRALPPTPGPAADFASLAATIEASAAARRALRGDIERLTGRPLYDA